MKKLMRQWMMAATLVCGLCMMSSCSEEKDNPVEPEPQPTPVESAERLTFEQHFSQQLAAMAEQVKFDEAIESTKALKDFVNTIDEEALKQQVVNLLIPMVGGAQPITTTDLTAEEQADIAKCLKAQFNMTDEELANPIAFVMLDASKALGKLHLTFKDGQCAIDQDGEGFTVESVRANGEVVKAVLTFSNENDGVRFFATRVGGALPLALQLPKTIGISLTTPKGNVMNGTVELVTGTATRYMNFKANDWMANATLTAHLNGREQTLYAYAIHSEDQSYGGKIAVNYGEQEFLSLALNGVKTPYEEGYFDNDEVKQLREMGSFFAGAYEVLRTLNGKSLEEAELVFGGNLSFKGSVDDITKCIIALGKLRQMYGTSPGFDAIDAQTQELNKYVHATVFQKSSGISAKASLITSVEDLQSNEYQPAIALTFEGETQPISIYDRMSEQDRANYHKMLNELNKLLTEMGNLIEAASDKVQVIGDAVKL